eukprot:CAMPEP_0115591262 /NCGR_PEP_ID=MMETSP0272-20121206/10186_1 /TAXON_ID=71861 /ORGANISM="Scrippsiella trochoidea, Strain CCMP3099" /LENGTH=314 /DNA_ID=CAMNT_0003026477 /DNA_START=15 /DNA_END=956 /DNA_ORIENTATION=-
MAAPQSAKAGEPAGARRFLAEVAPPLDGSSHKGQGGRIGILGGSADYTGAPFYAGLSSLRAGAELVYVLTAQEAALPLKTYSPELMVTPVYSGEGEAENIAKAVEDKLERLHALVVGNGLGRQPTVMEGALRSIESACAAGVPVVVDADGVQAVITRLSAVQGRPSVVLTPNIMEFRRLCDAAGVDRAVVEGPRQKAVEALSSKLGGTTVLLKGPEDMVAASGQRLSGSCGVEGAPRRSGGLGDILAGMIGTLLGWLRPGADGIGESGWHAADAALVGCLLTRSSCRSAFARRKRAMTAPDVMEHIGEVFEELC